MDSVTERKWSLFNSALPWVAASVLGYSFLTRHVHIPSWMSLSFCLPYSPHSHYPSLAASAPQVENDSFPGLIPTLPHLPLALFPVRFDIKNPSHPPRQRLFPASYLIQDKGHSWSWQRTSQWDLSYLSSYCHSSVVPSHHGCEDI